ncbi:MAG: ATP-binding cassette domain-containing protein, partial [Duncaniella sp.]|nr:ATP-binding cassette domain-containing protein [Duncaniella sp.]
APEELDEARTWLRLLDISHIADRRFQELSSGEQRLVLLARAFIKQPSLLILDEPLHGLDAARKERVRRLIDLLVGRNGTSLIFVTHYTREIPSTVTKVKTLQKI